MNTNIKAHSRQLAMVQAPNSHGARSCSRSLQRRCCSAAVGHDSLLPHCIAACRRTCEGHAQQALPGPQQPWQPAGRTSSCWYRRFTAARSLRDSSEAHFSSLRGSRFEYETLERRRTRRQAPTRLPVSSARPAAGYPPVCVLPKLRQRVLQHPVLLHAAGGAGGALGPQQAPGSC